MGVQSLAYVLTLWLSHAATNVLKVERIHITHQISSKYIDGLTLHWGNSRVLTGLYDSLIQNIDTFRLQNGVLLGSCVMYFGDGFIQGWFYAPSQWETSLQSNAVSHWLRANLESTLFIGLHCNKNHLLHELLCASLVVVAPSSVASIGFLMITSFFFRICIYAQKKPSAVRKLERRTKVRWQKVSWLIIIKSSYPSDAIWHLRIWSSFGAKQIHNSMMTHYQLDLQSFKL